MTWDYIQPCNSVRIVQRIRNIAISLLRLAGITQITRTIQAISRNPARILDIIPLQTSTYPTLP